VTACILSICTLWKVNDQLHVPAALIYSKEPPRYTVTRWPYSRPGAMELKQTSCFCRLACPTRILLTIAT